MWQLFDYPLGALWLLACWVAWAAALDCRQEGADVRQHARLLTSQDLAN